MNEERMKSNERMKAMKAMKQGNNGLEDTRKMAAEWAEGAVAPPVTSTSAGSRETLKSESIACIDSDAEAAPTSEKHTVAAVPG